MALPTSANDLAFEDIESSEQRRCAMTLVVVGHRAGSAFLHRQAGLGAVQRLDLRFFIDREDDGMGGRIDIKPLGDIRPEWWDALLAPNLLRRLQCRC